MSEEAATAAVPRTLGAEAVELLASLIRLDTSNPPGNEAPAQELLAATLARAGFECEMLAAEPGRPNLVARLRGAGGGPTLCLLGHADTVPADRSEWSFDPWGGEVAGGEVRGRGAQDMKDQVAAEVAACAALGSAGWRPAAGELLVVITADEEAGALKGAKWLCEEHPDVVRADLVLNEGGGASFELGGRRFYTLSVGEKGVFRFALRTRGRAGHGSVPALGDNALLRLAPLITRLAEQPDPVATPAAVAFLSAVLGERIGDGGRPLAEALAALRDGSPLLAAYLAEPMARITLAPTMARASGKANVIPSRAEAIVDCRVPPGLGEDEAREAVAGLLGQPGDGGYELEFVESVGGNESPLDTPLYAAIERWLERSDPGAAIAPIVMPGFSDSHWWRRAFDATVVYGFCPQRAMSLFEAAPLVHSADERIPVADVELGAAFFWEIVQEVLG